MRFALYVIGLSSALWLSVSIPAAAAGKPVNVAKVSGLAYAVQANDSHWLSCWAEQPNGQFKLMVIDADKGLTTKLKRLLTGCMVLRWRSISYGTVEKGEPKRGWRLVVPHAWEVRSSCCPSEGELWWNGPWTPPWAQSRRRNGSGPLP